MKTQVHPKLFMKRILILTLLSVAVAAHAQSWTNRYEGTVLTSWTVKPIAVDAMGNVFVMCMTLDADTNYAFLTIKYSGSGVPVWTNRYNPASSGWVALTALAVDQSGNVIVTGNSQGDFGTIKYSIDGVPLWTNRYDGPAHGDDMGWAVAVDGAGNVFVAGESVTNDASTGVNYSDSATIKYSSGGLPLWTNRHDGFRPKLAVDGSGNVVVGDTVYGLAGGDYGDYTTVKYAGNGTPLWTNVYGASASSTDRVESMALATNGNVVVTGHTVESDFDWVTVAYSSAGLPLWTNRFNGPANGEDAPAGVAVDREGNLIVVGYSWTGNSFDYLTIKYSGDGVPLWTNSYDGPANGAEFATALAVDATGNTIVSGHSRNGTGYDYATVAYSSSGVALWTNRYDGAGNGDDYANAIAVDGNGNVFVTGTSWNGIAYDSVTIKYAAQNPLPYLNIQRLANGVVLNWTNAAFGLQSAPTITGTFTNVPGATSPYTNAINGGQQFFRLVQ